MAKDAGDGCGKKIGEALVLLALVWLCVAVMRGGE